MCMQAQRFIVQLAPTCGEVMLRLPVRYTLLDAEHPNHRICTTPTLLRAPFPLLTLVIIIHCHSKSIN